MNPLTTFLTSVRARLSNHPSEDLQFHEMNWYDHDLAKLIAIVERQARCIKDIQGSTQVTDFTDAVLECEHAQADVARICAGEAGAE